MELRIGLPPGPFNSLQGVVCFSSLALLDDVKGIEELSRTRKILFMRLNWIFFVKYLGLNFCFYALGPILFCRFCGLIRA